MLTVPPPSHAPVTTPITIPMSRHAHVRSQQRGVCLKVLDCLLAYGHREHDHRGATVVVFNRAALASIRLAEPSDLSRAVAECRTLYAVVDSDGLVVTTGYRFRRVVRDLSISNLRPRQSKRVRGRVLS